MELGAHKAEDGNYSDGTGMPGQENSYVAVDVETTGLSPGRGDRVVELGAAVIENNNITHEFHALINAGKSISAQAQRVHGITNEMIFGKPKPEEIFPRLRALIGDRILVAHNAAFDIGFLREEFNRIGLGSPMRYLCTLELSRAMFPRLQNHRLETVYRHLCKNNAASGQRHRALDDARMVARVWMEMMSRSWM